MSEKYIFLSKRKDGKGAHFIMNIAEFLLSKFYKINLYFDKNYRICTGDKITNSMYFKPIINESKHYDSIKKSSLQYYDGVRGPSAKFCELTKQDTISYFKQYFKNKFYDIIKKDSEIRNFNLPWNNNKNIICIHIRLEDIVKCNPVTLSLCDVTNRKDYDGQGSFNYIKNLIENNNFVKYNREISDSHGLDTQAPIDLFKLENLIKKFKIEYSEKEIYIITYCKKIPDLLKNIINKYNLKIYHNNNEDYDLWLMIHSDILVLSKSTYSIMAGYYHQGSKVYYPYWGVAASLGLGSKYDKSGWVGYV